MKPISWPELARRIANGIRLVDNNRLARDVVYHTIIAAELLQQGLPFDGPAVHEFVRKNIRYEADDDPMNQRVRMPWRTLSDGVTDCKSSSIMIASLAKAAGRVVTLRFIDQTGSGQWDHVYAIVDGIPIDPLEDYGTELPYKRSHDEPI